MDKITYFFCITKYFNKNFNIELDKILFFPSFESLYCILFLRKQTAGISRTCGKVETIRTVFYPVCCNDIATDSFFTVQQFRLFCIAISPNLLTNSAQIAFCFAMKRNVGGYETPPCCGCNTAVSLYYNDNCGYSYRQ